MSVGVLGRAIVLVGMVCGLLAVSLPAVSGPDGSFRYVDDGTVAVFLLVLLSLSSWWPADVGSATLGAALGATAFGFFLYLPALNAFDGLGSLSAGAWLGLCTLLIPLGVLLAAASSFEPAHVLPGPGMVIGVLGIALVVAGIWSPVHDGGESFWNSSTSGHALGLAMLLLAGLNAALLVVAAVWRARVGELRVVAAAATFGLVAANVIEAAFENFGTLGSGAWVEACGGVLVLLGAVRWSPALAGYEEAPASVSQSPR